jgi:hypothetical protein
MRKEMEEQIETAVVPDVGEKLTIPYGSLKPNNPAPVAQSAPESKAAQQTPPPQPPSTENK